MGRGLRRQAPALVVACIALIAALGGTVYAAKKIDGKTIKAKSLPGNRLALGSVPGNRLKPGSIGRRAAGAGRDHRRPRSTRRRWGRCRPPSTPTAPTRARDAQTALNAVNAIDATKVNGHSAGCKPPARFFAGACWQTNSSEAAVTAPAAALACATQGGELPDALSLVAFSQQPGIALAAEDEWTGDIPVISGTDVYSVITVSPSGKITSAASTSTKKYRCVIPLVS